MRRALYIVGAPGAGKSTLVHTLAAGHLPVQYRKPLAHLRYEEAGVVELGARRPTFSGTDALAMSAVVPASEWVADTDPFTGPGDLLLAEGDRLANDRFFEALQNGGWELTVAHLAVSPETAARRRARRGSDQNETWVKGRETKVAKLVDRWREHVLTLDGTASPRHIAADLAHVHPVAHALMNGGAA